jgi:hypothetical protein
MRRVALLVLLTTFVIWANADELRSACGGWWTATLQAAGFEPTIPHWGCVDNQCVEIYECGFDDCTECEGCDPDEEWACISSGREWDPSTCACLNPVCNPFDEQDCVDDWGTWDPSTCSCINACNAGEAQEVDSWDDWTFLGCTGCEEGSWLRTEGIYYEQRCEDGRLWDSYTIETGYVETSWEPDLCWEYCYEL